MKEKNIFLKILSFLMIGEIIAFFIPWMVFVPLLREIFPEGFVQVGWIYSVFAIMAFVPTLILFFIADSIVHGKQRRSKLSKVDLVAHYITWAIIVALPTFWIVSILGLFD